MTGRKSSGKRKDTQPRSAKRKSKKQKAAAEDDAARSPPPSPHWRDVLNGRAQAGARSPPRRMPWRDILNGSPAADPSDYDADHSSNAPDSDRDQADSDYHPSDYDSDHSSDVSDSDYPDPSDYDADHSSNAPDSDHRDPPDSDYRDAASDGNPPDSDDNPPAPSGDADVRAARHMGDYRGSMFSGHHISFVFGDGNRIYFNGTRGRIGNLDAAELNRAAHANLGSNNADANMGSNNAEANMGPNDNANSDVNVRSDLQTAFDNEQFTASDINNQMKVAHIRAELEKRGLDTTGKKTEISQRLWDALNAASPGQQLQVSNDN